MNNQLKVAQLAMMLSSDYPKAPVDVLYIPGLSTGMLEASGLFDHTVTLYDKTLASIIAFNGGDGRTWDGNTPGEAWPGADYYSDELMSRGVPIVDIVPTGPGLHTREEVKALITMAKAREWKRIGFITIPYHYPRAFCFLVKAMMEVNWHPDVFALNPPTTNWYMEMGASQGKGMTTPEAAAYDDAEKLLVQIDKDWAAPLDHVLSYLRARSH